MADVARGTTHNWPAYTRNGVGALTDAVELQVTVYDSDEVVVDGFPQDLDGAIVHDGTGQYHCPWVIPEDQAIGAYSAHWVGVGSSGEALAGIDTINVVLPGTIEPVELTGSTLSYLTPERLRSLPLGVSFVNWTDLELAELISDASAEVHAYCNVPLEGAFSFLGGSVDEEHTWRLPDNPFDTGQTRIYPRVQNVISVDSVQLQLSANTFQTIPTSSFVVNNVEGWLELSALVLNPGIFGISFFIFPLAALEKPVVRVSLTYGKTWAREGERLYPTVAGGRTYQAPDGFWTGAAPSLAGAGVPVDPGDYVVDRASGQVTFAEEADLPAAPVTASYATRIDREIAKATGLICEFLGARRRSTGRLLIGGATSVKAGEISITRNIPGRSASSGVIEDLAHDVPGAARLLNGHRFFRIA